ncbi:MAG: DsbA family protein [Anaerolineaceae bacterium]|nr:DsbA family protein [Anaerolineaceae bacterium]
MKKYEQKNKKRGYQQYLPLFLVVTSLVVVVVIFGNSFLNQKEPVEPIVTEISALRAQGSANAPITITEFADFGCITCKAWHQFGIKDRILEKYGDQVRFVWRDFPVITVDSPKAAEAGFCAHDQGRFWDYHDVLYQNAPALKTDNLKQYAAELGLDTQVFNQCLDSGQHTSSVDNELQEALSFGFRGAPSFLVNDQRLIGPPSFEQLSVILDEIIRSQGES